MAASSLTPSSDWASRDMAWTDIDASTTRKASLLDGTASSRASSSRPSPHDVQTRAVGGGAPLGEGAAQCPQNQSHVAVESSPPSTSLSAGLWIMDVERIKTASAVPLHPPSLTKEVYESNRTSARILDRFFAFWTNDRTERGGFEPPNEVNPRYAISSRARSAAPAPLQDGDSA